MGHAIQTIDEKYPNRKSYKMLRRGFTFPVLPKHTLFKVLYFIWAKFKNYTLYFISVKYFKNTLLWHEIV